jgi:hypothetical protein
VTASHRVGNKASNLKRRRMSARTDLLVLDLDGV